MNVTLHLNKNRIRFKRNAADVLYAQANDQCCIIYFINGEVFYYGYRLKIFEQKVICLNELVRVHRSYLIKLCEVVNYTYLKATLSNGKKIPLNDHGYAVVKEYIDRRNSSSPSSSVA